MSEQKIVIDISENGEIKAETFGITGVGCIAELDKLMKDLALSGTVSKKPEYFQEGIKSDSTIKAKND